MRSNPTTPASPADATRRTLAERLLVSDHPEAGMLFYNHNHDGKGRFSSGGGGRVVSSADVGHAMHARKAAAKAAGKARAALDKAHGARWKALAKGHETGMLEAKEHLAHEKYRAAVLKHLAARNNHHEVLQAYVHGMRWGGGSR